MGLCFAFVCFCNGFIHLDALIISRVPLIALSVASAHFVFSYAIQRASHIETICSLLSSYHNKIKISGFILLYTHMKQSSVRN